MSCPYLNKEKDSVWSGIYCNRIGDRPGNDYWSCYCDGRYSDCPHQGGSDPYMLHPDTKRRKQQEEDQARAREVDRLINRIPSHITAADERTIESAANAYDRLTYDQQRYVNGYYTLTNALRELEKAKSNESSAESVTQMIAGLPGRVTAADERGIRSVRSAYDRLSYEQKRLVRNLSALENAEQALAEELRNSGSQRNTYGTGENGAPNYDEDEEWTVDRSKWPLKQRLWFRFEHFVDNRLNPRMYPPAKMILTSRILLPVIAALCLLVDYQNIPRSIQWMYMVFCGCQLLCLGLAYVLPGRVKLRLVFWGITALSLAVPGISIAVAYTADVVVWLGVMTFLVPIVWIFIKSITWFAELIAKSL